MAAGRALEGGNLQEAEHSHRLGVGERTHWEEEGEGNCWEGRNKGHNQVGGRNKRGEGGSADAREAGCEDRGDLALAHWRSKEKKKKSFGLVDSIQRPCPALSSLLWVRAPVDPRIASSHTGQMARKVRDRGEKLQLLWWWW